jgi:hypothetical protein
MSETAISNVRKRKRLLRLRARLSEAWDQAFPNHEFETGHLREPRSLAADAWNHPRWAKAAREYHEARAGRPTVVETEPERLVLLRHLLDDDVSIERAWNEINDPHSRPTPQSTVEAILYCVRERGIAALKEPVNLEQLARCDAAAKSEIDRRIGKLIGHHV